MSSKNNVGKEFVQEVSRLQNLCKKVFSILLKKINSSMSEDDLADLSLELFAEEGIHSHWYDVPVVSLIGIERFVEGTTTYDYSVKSPSSDVYLEENVAVHLDFSPIDPKTNVWGDWSSTFVYKPSNKRSNEQLKILGSARKIQRNISFITSNTTGKEIADHFQREFQKMGLQLKDVRNNVGHSIHNTAKSDSNRVWLDQKNSQALGSGIFTIEPGGISMNGKYMARFEECIFIPENGPAKILGSDFLVPLKAD